VDFECVGRVEGQIAPRGRRVRLEESADYAVWFQVDPREADCVILQLNCHPVPGATYAGSGMVILRAHAGDELSLCVSGCGGCGPECGCEAVTASLLVLKLKAHCRHEEDRDCDHRHGHREDCHGCHDSD